MSDDKVTPLRLPSLTTTPIAGVTSNELRERLRTAPKAISLDKLLSLNLPERRELLAPWLRAGESAMIWAPTGLGKSWFALSVALAVAGGGNVLGWQAAEPARVLYLDGEMAVDEIRDRMRNLLDAGAIEGIDQETARRNLDFHSRQQQGLSTQFWDMLDTADQAALVKVIQDGGYSLVILDNFTVLSDSLTDENSAGAMKPALRLLMLLKQAGVSAILVHHANKSGDSYRGSSAIAATFEIIVGLKATNDPREDRRNSAGFTISFEKFRGKRDDTLDDRKAFLVNRCWEVEPLEDLQAKRVVAAYRSLHYETQADIGRALNMAQGTVSKALAYAVAFELITRPEATECLRKAKALRSGAFDDEAEF